MKHLSLFLLCCCLLQGCSNRFWANATDIQADQKILLVSTFPESFHIKQIHSYMFSFSYEKDVDVKSWNINNFIKKQTLSSLKKNYQIEQLDTEDTFSEQPETSFLSHLHITDEKLLQIAQQKKATYIMIIHPKKINHIPRETSERAKRHIKGIGLYNNEYVYGGRKIQHALIDVSLFDSKTGDLIFTSNNSGVAYHDLQQAFTSMKFKF